MKDVSLLGVVISDAGSVIRERVLSDIDHHKMISIATAFSGTKGAIGLSVVGHDMEYAIRVRDDKPQCSAELSAIIAALRLADSLGSRRVTLLVAHLNFLKLLLSSEQHAIKETINQAIRQSDIELITLCWIPHEDEILDRAKVQAKAGLLAEEITIIRPSTRYELQRRLSSVYGQLLSQNINDIERSASKHVTLCWPVERCQSRAIETAITRFRLNRSRLKADLFRWHISESPLCTYCGRSDETSEHYFLVCPAHSYSRLRLMQFLDDNQVADKLSGILSLGYGLAKQSRRTLVNLIGEYFVATSFIG
jgi:hypothetical protein